MDDHPVLYLQKSPLAYAPSILNHLSEGGSKEQVQDTSPGRRRENNFFSSDSFIAVLLVVKLVSRRILPVALLWNVFCISSLNHLADTARAPRCCCVSSVATCPVTCDALQRFVHRMRPGKQPGLVGSPPKKL